MEDSGVDVLPIFVSVDELCDFEQCTHVHCGKQERSTCYVGIGRLGYVRAEIVVFSITIMYRNISWLARNSLKQATDFSTVGCEDRYDAHFAKRNEWPWMYRPQCTFEKSST